MNVPPQGSEAAFVAEAARLLQAESAPFPAQLQRVLQLAERTWPPLRASVTLSDGLVLVTGQSEFPSGGLVTTHAVVRGARRFGTLSLERPAGTPGEGPSESLPEALAALVAQEAEIRRLFQAPLSPGDDLVGSSGVMQDVFRLVDQAAPAGAPVLFLGEPGVGKERLAEALHRRSLAAAGPFVVFNGTGLPETMVESELFGPLRTGGGRLAEARGGTLYIDEVADLSPLVQGRLVKALADRGQPRLVVSSRRNLDTLAAAGRFRSDLLDRLAVHRIQIPPLRDRGSDIVALADHFVARFSLQTGKTIKRISTPTLEMLLTYPWPGNVRELQNVMERAVLLSDDEVIHGYHLPPSLQSSVHSGTQMHGRLTDRLDSLEYEMLVEALKASLGNITQAARELGLTKRVMGLRMKKFELDYRPFRQGPADLAEDDDWN